MASSITATAEATKMIEMGLKMLEVASENQVGVRVLEEIRKTTELIEKTKTAHPQLQEVVSMLRENLPNKILTPQESEEFVSDGIALIKRGVKRINAAEDDANNNNSSSSSSKQGKITQWMKRQHHEEDPAADLEE